MYFDLFSAAPPLRSLSACEQLSQEGRGAADAARCRAGVWRPIRTLIRLQHPSLSPAHLFTTARLFLPLSPCLRQEDGTVHSASCTRTRGVSERLAAGRLKSTMPCYVRFLLLLLCVILIGECKKHRSRKRRWSAPVEPHKPGTWVLKSLFFDSGLKWDVNSRERHGMREITCFSRLPLRTHIYAQLSVYRQTGTFKIPDEAAAVRSFPALYFQEHSECQHLHAICAWPKPFTITF